MVSETERRIVLDLLAGKRAFADIFGYSEPAARALIRNYLAEKATLGPGRVETRVRSGATIVRDERGIPHISATDEYDLFFAHGYAQAQDRLWQLDYLRRQAHGRLAAIFGASRLHDDILVRTLGIGAISTAAFAASHPDSRDAFRAFADGCNAWMSHLPAGLPIEFELLGYEPEPWSPVDSVAILRRWLWYLTGRLPVITTPECVRATIGDRETEFYRPDGPIAYIVPPGNYDPAPSWPDLPTTELEALAWGPQEPGGSNNWAVAPAMTRDGHALVASDPHVYYAVPSDFYEVHLQGAGYDVAGTTYAGVPMPRIGRNRHLAWGITNNICMQRDLYVEQLSPNDPASYLEGDTWRPLEHRQETIPVRDAHSHQLDICFAHGRPIVDHLIAPPALPKNLWSPERGGNTALSLAWVGFGLSDEPKAFLDLGRARNVAEGRQALSLIRCPTWNYVLADSQGEVGYQCTGSIPLRGRAHRGYRDANNPLDAWLGSIPFTGLPSLQHPDRGWVGSANNPTAPPDFPYPLSGSWTVEDRAARIETLLERLAPHTASTFRAMQDDILSGRGVRGVPPLVEQLESSRNPRFSEPARFLREWDRNLAVDQVGASIYFVFFWRWHQHVVRQRFPDEMALIVQDAGWGLSSALLQSDPTAWFDSEQERQQAIETSMHEALDWLEDRLGSDPGNWQWGKIHQLGATHPAATNALQHEFLDIPPQPGPGGPGTLCSAFYVPPGSFDTRIGPVFRIIASLDPAARTETISWPGQSGHPGSPHYADQVERQLAGACAEFPIAWDDVLTQATAETNLTPRG